MNRTLKLSMLIALTLGSTQALALGLGQIRVKSALDKPLVAEIPLVADYPGEADNVHVALASAQDFARAGLDRSAFPANLQFEVVTDASGQKLIRVTTAEPVRQTYLDFLLEVEWPRGKLLREFTVLLDPPHMLTSRGASGTTGRASAPAPSPAAAGKPAPMASASSAASGSGRISGGKYGPVHSGETLSRIAQNALPQGVSLNQMMVAMYEANRGAFVRDNMNLLKRGAVLRIPSRDQAQAKSAAAAASEVRQQYEDWKGMAAHAPTVVSNTGGSMGSGARGGSASSGGDRLKLVPPKEGAGGVGQAGVSGGTGNATVTGLRQDLARTKESLDNLQAESKDLKSRLDALQKIHDKNQQLLSLKNSEIAELQQKLAEARKAAAVSKSGSAQSPSVPAAAKTAPSTPAAVAMKVTAPAAASAATTTPASAGTAAVASAPASAGTAVKASVPTPAKPVAPKPKPVSAKRPPVHPTPAAEPWYMQTWTWIAGAAVGVFLLVLGLVRLRSGGKPATPRPSLADQFSEEEFGVGGVETDMDEEQSELLAELAEHPDEIGLHLELVSLYYARRDVDHFEAAAEAMYAHISDPEQPEWQEVRAMGEELVPEHPLFADNAPAHTDAADVVLPDITGSDSDYGREDAFDVDHLVSGHEADLPETGFAINDLGSEIEPEAEPRVESEGYNFDFDLTPSKPGGSAGHVLADDDADILPPLPEEEPHLDEMSVGASALNAADDGVSLPDDPIDTKLDLARAYLDMGDPSGARAMLEEVLAEGTQLQRDVAQKLLDDIA